MEFAIQKVSLQRERDIVLDVIFTVHRRDSVFSLNLRQFRIARYIVKISGHRRRRRRVVR